MRFLFPRSLAFAVRRPFPISLVRRKLASYSGLYYRPISSPESPTGSCLLRVGSDSSHFVAPDYGALRDFFQNHWASKKRIFLCDFVANSHASQLSCSWPGDGRTFPWSSLLSLSEECCQVVFPRRQVACLVVQQFLCSLPCPPWPTASSADLHI